jgi:hypothetical protein
MTVMLIDVKVYDELIFVSRLNYAWYSMVPPGPLFPWQVKYPKYIVLYNLYLLNNITMGCFYLELTKWNIYSLTSPSSIVLFLYYLD